MHPSLLLWRNTFSSSDPLEKDKDYPSAVQRRQGEQVDYSKIHTQKGGKLQQGTHSCLDKLTGYRRDAYRPR